MQRILQEIMKKKIILKHQTLGQWDNWTSDQAYYIEDCQILEELGLKHKNLVYYEWTHKSGFKIICWMFDSFEQSEINNVSNTFRDNVIRASKLSKNQ